MTAKAIAEIESAIEMKQRELDTLVYARDILLGLADVSLPVVPPKRAAASNGLSSQSSGKESTGPSNRAARLNAIAARAQGTVPANIQGTAPPTDGRRRRFSPEQKEQIVNEYESAPVKGFVLRKHSITYSSIHRWQKTLPGPGVVVAPPTTPVKEAQDDEAEEFAEPVRL